MILFTEIQTDIPRSVDFIPVYEDVCFSKGITTVNQYILSCRARFSTVITGTVITAVMRGGSMFATVSIINVYKEGSLAIQQAGKTMSTKIIILCKKCPFVRRGESTGEIKLAQSPSEHVFDVWRKKKIII